MKKIILLPLLISLISISCDKDDDNDEKAPTISNATINGLTEEIIVNTGGDLKFEALLSDDQELGEFKIDIHDIFDGHSHGKKASTPWVYTQTYSLDGVSKNFESTITVAQNIAAGPYHSIMRLLDESGNESEFKEIDFMILNGSEAQIAISSPDFSSEVHVDKGDSLNIFGQISDDIDIEEIIIALEETEHGHGKKQEDALFEADFDLTGTADVLWDFQADGSINIKIPTTAESGDYVFEVIVKDSDGNLNIFEGHVHIH